MNKIKILIIFWSICYMFISGHISANIAIEPLVDLGEKHQDSQGFGLKMGNVKIDYNIGLNNRIFGGSIFYPIDIQFSDTVEGTLEIYSENFDYSGEIGDGQKMYKSIVFNNTTHLQTYFRRRSADKGYRNKKFYFYINIKNKKKKLGVINNEYRGGYGSELYIFPLREDVEYKISISEVKDLFFLQQFKKIYLQKKSISESERTILQDYVFAGGTLILGGKDISSQEQLEYLSETINIRKKAYSKNDCHNNNKCKNTKYYYQYGFGQFFVEKNYHFMPFSKNISSNQIKQMLIDKEIESKFVPFNVILYFIIAYFLILICVSFVLGKRMKKNKFFLLYGLPITSLGGLIVIFSITLFYKGVNDIENKIQINHHKDGKILKEVYSTTFSASGGNYTDIVEYQDYREEENIFSHPYGRNKAYAKKEIHYENGKIHTQYLGVNSSGFISSLYSHIVDDNITEGNMQGKIFDTTSQLVAYIRKQNRSKSEANKIKKDKKIIHNYSPIIPSIVGNKIGDISKIVVRNVQTEYMKKYSLTGKMNKYYVIDIFYK